MNTLSPAPLRKADVLLLERAGRNGGVGYRPSYAASIDRLTGLGLLRLMTVIDHRGERRVYVRTEVPL